MAKCKDCIHVDVCRRYLMKSEVTPEELNEIDNTEQSKKICDFFKDKSHIVELPCRVGETIYALGCPSEPIEAWTILSPSIAYEENGYIHHTPLNYVIHSIGKTVFLSREEAERALESFEERE
ncbi:MAG: hypothetical protein ACI4JB_07415 [Porcipelethomonas sp.]